MLANSNLIAFVPTRDADRARTFYQNTLGLRFLHDDTFAIVMESGPTTIRIVRVGEFTPFPFTLLGWDVADIEAAVKDLADKGVEFHRYTFLEQSPTGIWTAPGGAAKVAWFSDPDGNTLSLSQH